MSYLRYEQQIAFRAHDNMVTAAAESLQSTPGMDDALYGDKADYLQAITTSFVPNIDSHGVVSVPSEYQDTDATAVLLVADDSVFTLDETFQTLTPSQRAAAVFRLVEISDKNIGIEEADTLLGDLQPFPFPDVSVGQTMRAFTTAYRGEIPNTSHNGLLPKGTLVACRPLVAYSTTPEAHGQTGIGLNTVIHESTHVFGLMDDPVVSVKDHVQRKQSSELEAYHKGARALRLRETVADDCTHTDLDAFTLRIDAMRELATYPDEPFILNDEGNRLFVNTGLNVAVPVLLPSLDVLGHKLAWHRRYGGGTLGALKLVLKHYQENA